MTQLRIAAAAGLALMLGGGPVLAGNAPGRTPANVAVLPNILYKIAYWSDYGEFSSYPSVNTTVIITSATAASGACHFQIEWINAGGYTVGYTGGSPNYESLQTQVLTSIGTTNYGSYPPLPIMYYGFGVPFVYSNMSNPSTFGSANVRSDCAASTKVGIVAYLSSYNAAPTPGNGQVGGAPNAMVSIPVTRPAGDTGD